MMRALGDNEPGRGYLLAELDRRFLWGDPAELPYNTDICVFREVNEVLYCSTPTAPPVLAAIAHEDAPSALRQLESTRQDWYLADTRILLEPKLFIYSWTVVVSRPESEALRPASAFMHLFLPVLALAVEIVMHAQRHPDPTHARTARAPYRRHTAHRGARLRRSNRHRSPGRIPRALADSSTHHGVASRQTVPRAHDAVRDRSGRLLHWTSIARAGDHLDRLNDVIPADYVPSPWPIPPCRSARSHVQDYHTRSVPFARAQVQREEIEELVCRAGYLLGRAWGGAEGYLAPLAAFACDSVPRIADCLEGEAFRHHCPWVSPPARRSPVMRIDTMLRDFATDWGCVVDRSAR